MLITLKNQFIFKKNKKLFVLKEKKNQVQKTEITLTNTQKKNHKDMGEWKSCSHRA